VSSTCPTFSHPRSPSCGNVPMLVAVTREWREAKPTILQQRSWDHGSSTYTARAL
jgi:hypothetical protein